MTEQHTIFWMLFGAIYLTCSIASAGLFNACFQRKYELIWTPNEWLWMVLPIALGPIGLFASLIVCLGYGWSLRRDARLKGTRR